MNQLTMVETDVERLGNRVQIGTIDETQRLLTTIFHHFQEVCQWITKNVPRTEQSLTLFNILSSSAAYIKVAADNLQNHISVLALATRSLYELHLRVRYILASPDNMRAWQAEAAMDKIQVLEGVLELETVGDTRRERAMLQDEIARIKSLLSQHNLPEIKRLPTTRSIAESVGKSSEHKALFKLFSKLVHPSSYLVNNYLNAASAEVSIILQIHLQLFAWDLFSRICDALSVPETVRSFSYNGQERDA